MNRITSRDGNVIAADFGARIVPASRKPGEISVSLSCKTAILYCDEVVCLVRVTCFLNGQQIGVQHVTVETPAA